jgi:hypothetical protein
MSKRAAQYSSGDGTAQAAAADAFYNCPNDIVT